MLLRRPIGSPLKAFPDLLQSDSVKELIIPPWALTDQTEYRELDLRAHAILKGVPLLDVWRLDLPGGGEGRTVADVRSLASRIQQNAAVRFLFALRSWLGRLFGWDREPAGNEGLFQHCLSQEDCSLSSVPTGTKEGPFTVLYIHPTEAMSEIRNSTVHAALVWALIPREEGYRLFWGIYVKPVGGITAFYMGLIKPFRRWIVYPSLFRNLHRAWRAKYDSA